MESITESVSKARFHAKTLLSLLPPSNSNSLSSLADSDHPARSLLDSYEAYSVISSALNGSSNDPLCQWLYDTFLESSHDSESNFRLLVVSLVPLITSLYYSRILASSITSPATLDSPSLAGFEAVLLSLYCSEVKSRAGNPLLVSVPSLSYLAHHPSLYHTPTTQPQPSSSSHFNSFYSRSFSYSSPSAIYKDGISVGVLSPALEPQIGINSTNLASILGVAFHIFFKHISQMPPWSKIDFCRLAASWAGDDCSCALSPDFQNSLSSSGEQDYREEQGVRILLPWELMQPLLRVLSHCLLGPASLITQEIKDTASVAARRLYARACHDLAPQAILATRSLVQLDNRARAAAKAATLPTSSSAKLPIPLI